ncbi:SNF2 family N-terminal domain-containing protein [Globomyces pollinis-pini]|nr:SNF2 family N-terminal domain-containing protein [Globomyces pollinis-pini]
MRKSNAPSQRKGLTPFIQKDKSETNQKFNNALSSSSNSNMWNVVFRRRQFKKHKTWENDGYLLIGDSLWTLLNESKEIMCKTAAISQSISESDNFQVGPYEVECVSETIETQYPIKSPSNKSNNTKKDTAEKDENSNPITLFQVVYRKPQLKKHTTWDNDGLLYQSGESLKLVNLKGKIIFECKYNGNKIVVGDEIKLEGKEIRINEILNGDNTCNISDNPIGSYKTSTSQSVKQRVLYSSIHDPLKENAILFNRPTFGDEGDIIDVVLDPLVGRQMRQHQIEGVKFLYDCLMGFKGNGGYGAILADEMGLGKTLQSISLVWTLMKQTPFRNSPPPVKRNNWKNEFHKWLGSIRINVCTVDANTTSIQSFFTGRANHILIIGYEKLKRFQTSLVEGSIDLCICDEGHRLKNGNLQAIQILQKLRTRRRLILTGTPIQNDLTEFYHLVNFVNPGVLGDQFSFKSTYETVISNSRSSECSPYQKQLGDLKLAELIDLTKTFSLRRTNDINQQFLPKKSEFVVFLKLQPEQQQLYEEKILEIGDINSDNNVLSQIVSLRQAASYTPSGSEDDILQIFEMSSKFRFIAQFLKSLKNVGSEKVVIVSHWTKTLDLIEKYCTVKGLGCLRLDGSIATAKRQPLVDQFNLPNSEHRCFLLSSKAGGVGLNLVGASRLILFDIDWNPSIDKQAMARIWRDGQTKPVFIYRLLSTGTIEEYFTDNYINVIYLHPC